MIPVCEIPRTLHSPSVLQRLAAMYCCDEARAPEHAERFCHVLEGLERTYGTHDTAALFSAPGRTEIGGNHTDHQHGCVLAAAVNIDMIAAAAQNGLGLLRLTSEGYDPVVIDLAQLEKQPEEENTSPAILRGTCRAFRDRGAALSGLDIYAASNVPRGSGVSSSAAFEVLIGVILNAFFLPDSPLSAVELAKIGQWVENEYFGKPCGLMDQTASAVGGAVGIDFRDPARPLIRQVDFDLKKAGLALCILDSGADHADLTEEYAAVPEECRQIARICGAQVLREVPYDTFLRMLPQCRAQCSDRAVLRAFHFFRENERARQEAEALAQEDYGRFLELVNASGRSSWEYLQNVTPAGSIRHQAVAVAIAAARELLDGRGAVRVHGGGFAGTVQAFVPEAMAESFRASIEAILGPGTCHILSIRPMGGVRVL